MLAHREIIDAKRLGKVVNLPAELRNRDVEVIVLPVGKKKKGKKLSQDWANGLEDYREEYTAIELQ